MIKFKTYLKESKIIPFKEFVELDEMLKQVKTPEGKTKWAVVSKSDPSKVLQYYQGEGKPSKEWFDKVERRIQYFKHRG
jgi:hypothetical protein